MSLTANRQGGHTSNSRGPVVSQLARFEGRRQLKSPVLWLAATGSAVLVWLAVGSQPATLPWRSVAIAGACLPLAVAAMLLGNTAALRDHSSRVGETTDVVPTSRDLRMVGLVGGASASFLVSLAVTVFGIALSFTDEPAGTLSLIELAVGPVVVVLGQAVGVFLGRWIPNPLAAPLALVVLAGFFLIQDFWPGERTIPAASPYLPWRQPYTDWVQAEPRMPLVHLAYLLGLIALAGTLASRQWRALMVAAVVVVGSVVGLSRIEVAGEEVAAAVERWGDAQPRVCEEHQGVQFCALDGYQPWIDDWSQVVDRVRGLVPLELGLHEVRQTTSGMDGYNDGDPTVAHVQGRLPVDSNLSRQVLAPEMGLPGTGAEAAQ